MFNSPIPDSTNTALNRTWGTGSAPLATFGTIIAYHEMRRLQSGLGLDF